MSESLAKIVYRKLKHLHQVQWDTYSTYSKAPGSDTGVWRVVVLVPCRDAMYVWSSASNQLQAISIEDKDNVTTYQDYDFKLFIKVMKKILRGKSFNLNYESFCGERMRCTYKVIDSKDKERLFLFTKTYDITNDSILESYEIKELVNNNTVPLIKISFNVCTYPFDYLFQTMLEEAGIKIKSFKRL